MPEEKPNTIQVSETRDYEIPADRADLLVTVEGASLVTGQEALHKAREVAQLVQGLTEYGFSPENIYLQGVYATKYTGTITRTSHASYRLRIHCADLSTLGDLLGIVTGQKNATLNSIEWGYPNDDAQKNQWLQECITRMNEKAARIAASLVVRLLGVHTFSEKRIDEETQRRSLIFRATEVEMPFRRRTLNLAGQDFGLEFSHTQNVEISVEAEYLISGFGATDDRK